MLDKVIKYLGRQLERGRFENRNFGKLLAADTGKAEFAAAAGDVDPLVLFFFEGHVLGDKQA